jgi:replicative DNA helicase
MEAEQSLLGGLLIDNHVWDVVADIASEGDLYRYEHRRIYVAIGALILAGKPADVITVYEQLERTQPGKGNDCGGMSYLNALAQSVPSASNARRYAEIVRERSVLRQLLATGDAIVASAFNPQGRAVAQILDEAENKVLAIGEQGAKAAQGPQTMDKLVVGMIDRMTELHARGASEVTGLRTGYHDLDRMTAGMQPGDLIVLAARPSMGKTALAMNIAEHVAVGGSKPVLIFSMEMGAQQLALRLTGSVGRIDQQHLRTGTLNEEEWSRFAEAMERVGKAPISIDESPALSAAEIRARARRVARQFGAGGLGLVVVDYLQLMSGNSNASDENRATELGVISRGLKALAKELQCPVIALSQLNRSVEQRTDKRPMMSDLRESGAIEQDADVIMFIYRDDYYNKDSKEPGTAEIIVSKQRNGPTGTVRAAFVKALARFDNLALGA